MNERTYFTPADVMDDLRAWCRKGDISAEEETAIMDNAELFGILPPTYSAPTRAEKLKRGLVNAVVATGATAMCFAIWVAAGLHG